MPLWVLEIFMNTFNLNQCEAVSQIRTQEESEVQRQVDLDLDF